MADLNLKKAGAAGFFLLGMDVAYNMGSFSLSAPQTTERRMRDTEGSSETAAEAMKWVHISTAKVIVYTGFASLLAGSWWPFIGGAAMIADLQASYRYAVSCGRRARTPGGKMLGSLGVGLNGDQGGPADGASHSPPTPVGKPQSRVRAGAFRW